MTFPIDGWDLLTPEDLQANEFELGGQQWRIKKLLPIEAKKVLYRHVFPMFNSARNEIPAEATPQQMLITLLTASDPEHMEVLSAIFYRHCVEYKNDAGQWAPITRDVDYATKDLLPVEVMLLDIRAFAVNFGESVSKAVEEFQRRAMETDQTQTSLSQQTHSSTQELTQDTTQSQTSRRGRPKGSRK